MFVLELWLHHKLNKWTWVKENSNTVESGERETQIKNEVSGNPVPNSWHSVGV